MTCSKRVQSLTFPPVKTTGSSRSGITAPVLAVTGEKDLQVDPDDLEVIASLVPGGADTRRLADQTHLLWRDPNPPTPASYRRLLRQPVDAGLLTEVAHWLAQRLR